MKKYMFYNFGIIFLLVISYSTYSSDKSITLVADEWCPYNCEEKSERLGYVIDIAKHILKKHNYEIKYKVINWTRALRLVEKGVYDGAIGATVLEAKNLIIHKEPIGKSIDGLWTLKSDRWKYKGVKSLEKKVLAFTSNYDYGDDINQFIKTSPNQDRIVKLVGDDPLDLAIKFLRARKITAFIEDKNVFSYKIKQIKKTHLFKLAGLHEKKNDNRNNIYIGLSPKVKEVQKLANLLDEGIIQMRKSGELQKILENYGLEDWKE